MSDPEMKDMVDQLMGLIDRLADKVLEGDPADHEANYRLARDVGYDAAHQAGMGEEKAREAGANLELWTRELVRLILAGRA